MSPLSQRGGDMLLYLCPLSSSVQLVSVRSLLPCRRSSTRHWPNDGLMLAHRLRRWPSIKPAVVQRFVFAGSQSVSLCCGESIRLFSLQRFLWYRPSITRCWPDAGLMLAHCLRRRASISPVLVYVTYVGQRHRQRANINPALVHSIVTVPYHQHAGTAEWSTD